MASDRELKPHRRRYWGVEPEDAVEVERVRPDEPSADETRADARRILWRDSAILLIGVIVALLVVQLLPGVTGGPVADETALTTDLDPGASGHPGSVPPPGSTFGPIVDPGLGIDATARPEPGRTLPPTGTFRPDPGEPTPSPRPSRKPPATIAPPTPAPTPAPTPTPTPEPPPPPTVSISCQPTAPLTISCDASVSNVRAGSQVWSMGGPGTMLLGGDGTNSATWLYESAGSYTVVLTVTGDDGSEAADAEDVTVEAGGP